MSAIAQRVMKARKQSECRECWLIINVGDRIAQLAGQAWWIHIGCVPAVQDSRMRAQLGKPWWCEHCRGTHPISDRRCREQPETNPKGTTP